mmetsp:Transcript_14866/g.24586  ORF Transcript_14866/g.24586 Transcript_14866/m.24586 type:complete len:303 (-) Transcript_14866:148-1056(-)
MSAHTAGKDSSVIITNSRLSKVFGIHRFVAGLFALQLFFFCETLTGRGPASGVTNTSAPDAGELILCQSWAGFIAMVAYIVHQARSFRRQDQMGIGMGLLVCFALETSILAYYIAMMPLSKESIPTVVGLMLIFFGLFLAYFWALLEPTPMVMTDATVDPKNLLTTVLSLHRIAMNMFSLMLLLYPSSTFTHLFNDKITSTNDILLTQAWGCFVLAVASFAHVGSTIPSNAARAAVGRSMVVGFAPITVLYIYRLHQGELREPLGIALPLMAGCLIAYLTALVSMGWSVGLGSRVGTKKKSD